MQIYDVTDEEQLEFEECVGELMFCEFMSEGAARRLAMKRLMMSRARDIVNLHGADRGDDE